MKATTKGVAAKLFLGLQLTLDNKARLNQSEAWLERLADDETSHRRLNIIHFQNKEYIGMHIEDSITMNELKMNMLFCLDRFKLYFPDIHLDASKLTIFPQIFIS